MNFDRKSDARPAFDPLSEDDVRKEGRDILEIQDLIPATLPKECDDPHQHRHHQTEEDDISLLHDGDAPGCNISQPGHKNSPDYGGVFHCPVGQGVYFCLPAGAPSFLLIDDFGM
jgi:hypothetical protein